jgi:hypothetical protein
VKPLPNPQPIERFDDVEGDGGEGESEWADVGVSGVNLEYAPPAETTEV